MRQNSNYKIFISGKITGDADYKTKFACAKADITNSYRWCKENRSCLRDQCPFHDLSYVYTCRAYGMFDKQIGVIKPTEFNLEGKPWLVCMFVCLRELRKCDAVFMLNDWKESRGARWEHRYAKFLHKRIIYQKEARR